MKDTFLDDYPVSVSGTMPSIDQRREFLQSRGLYADIDKDAKALYVCINLI